MERERGRDGILAASATVKRLGGPCSATISRCPQEWGHFVCQEIYFSYRLFILTACTQRRGRMIRSLLITNKVDRRSFNLCYAPSLNNSRDIQECFRTGTPNCWGSLESGYSQCVCLVGLSLGTTCKPISNADSPASPRHAGLVSAF